MTLDKACTQILGQLENLVNQITPNDFSKPSEVLNGSTIGQHLRHTLEFFICFQEGYEKGVVNYDLRSHDKLLENDKFIALGAISSIQQFVSNLEWNRPLTLEVSYDAQRESFLTVETNAQRELVYNIEHAVHHMAIIKIGIRDVAPYIILSPSFGVATSTIRYHQANSASLEN